MKHMNAIAIDFAPRSLARALRSAPRATWVILALAALCWLGFAWKAGSLVQQRKALAATLQQVSAKVQTQLDERAARRQAASKIVVPEAQANAVNAAIAQLNLPWRDLFDALETATPASIALLSVEPDAKKHLLKGTAEAKTGEEMIAYIEQLKKVALFADARLTKHEINDQDPNKPLRFQFEAEWTEAAP